MIQTRLICKVTRKMLGNHLLLQEQFVAESRVEQGSTTLINNGFTRDVITTQTKLPINGMPRVMHIVKQIGIQVHTWIKLIISTCSNCECLSAMPSCQYFFIY